MIQNLGRYGSVTAEAAKVGGMENFIRLQKRSAVIKTAPFALVGGMIAGYIAKAQVARAEKAKAEALKNEEQD